MPPSCWLPCSHRTLAATFRLTVFVLGFVLLVAGTHAQTPPQPSSTKPVVARKTQTAPSAPSLPPPPVDCPLPKQRHRWARFPVGAWRTIRTVTQTFDEKGKQTASSETLFTDSLKLVSNETYQLENTTILELGGKRLRGATRVTQHSLISDASSESPLVTIHPNVDVSLSGRTVPCQRWELSIGEGPSRQIETVYYSEDVSPFVLRREMSAADGSAAGTTRQTTQVIGVDAPVVMDDKIAPGHWLQSRSTIGVRNVERLELHCDQVPGGLVRATATERDASGRRIRWTVSELDDFGLSNAPSKVEASSKERPRRRWRVFPRRRQ